jgi:hypothetical protein
MEHVHVTSRPLVESRTYLSDAGGWFQGQWGAIFASSVVGFATAVVMGTLGAAIGITTGAAMADQVIFYGDGAGAAQGIGLGVIVWAILTAIVVGAVAGSVLSRLARRDCAYSPALFGAVSWAGGIALALLVASSSASGLLAGLSGTGAVAAGEAVRDGRGLDARFDSRFDDSRGEGVALTPEERSELQAATEAAAASAAVAAWVALAGQVIGLVATMIAAGTNKTRVVAVTEQFSTGTGSTTTFAHP